MNTVTDLTELQLRRAGAGELCEPRDPPNHGNEQPVMSANLADDLSREVYCILGLPMDAVEMPEVLRRIEAAAAGRAPFLISTANVNFLVISQSDQEFMESILLSDLCLTDGMPIVWIARLLGLPIKHRIAGSDVFTAMRSGQNAGRPLKLFLFGGPSGVAAAAAKAINVATDRLQCVGFLHPGFGTVEEMSRPQLINQINASGADFLVVSLGAHKGHSWLMRNHRQLRVPVRSHFGAVMNFEAGTVKRAPQGLARLGFEWVWRIKEEPHLWRRYWHDGRVLIGLLLARILPLVAAAQWQRFGWPGKPQNLRLEQTQRPASLTLRLVGDATAPHAAHAEAWFRSALRDGKPLSIDLTATRIIDARFFGLLLMLRKCLKSTGLDLKFIGVSRRLRRLFHLHGVEYLLAE